VPEADRYRRAGIVFTIGIEMMLAAISWSPPPTAGSARWKPSAASPRLAARIPRRLGRGDVPSVPLRRIRCLARPQDRLPCRRWSTSQTIAKNAPLGIQVTKEPALTYIEAGERAAIDFIPKVRERVLNSQDMLEGLQSFVERRAAVFKGR
jgi:hypothetical protein